MRYISRVRVSFKDHIEDRQLIALSESHPKEHIYGYKAKDSHVGKYIREIIGYIREEEDVLVINLN